MKYRALGRTGLRVSEVSLGCNRVGEPSLDDAGWLRLLHRAVELGVTLVDTSESYVDGRSETLIGQAFHSRSEVLVATKFAGGRRPGLSRDEEDFSAAAIVRGAEASLRRLGRDRIDVFQLHSPSPNVLAAADWRRGLEELKRSGKIRLAAISLWENGRGFAEIEDAPLDVLQVMYNLLFPEAAERILPYCLQHGMGVLVRMPYQRGVLTGKFRPGQPVRADFRASQDREAADYVRRSESFRPLAEGRSGGLAGLALQYALAPAAASCVIPGARTLAQLEENIRHGDAPPLTSAAIFSIGCGLACRAISRSEGTVSAGMR